MDNEKIQQLLGFSVKNIIRDILTEKIAQTLKEEITKEMKDLSPQEMIQSLQELENEQEKKELGNEQENTESVPLMEKIIKLFNKRNGFCIFLLISQFFFFLLIIQFLKRLYHFLRTQILHLFCDFLF